MATNKPQVSIAIDKVQFIDREPHEVMTPQGEYRKSRLYIFLDSKSSGINASDIDDATLKVIRNAALDASLKAAGLSGTKAHWSQKAGCSCGCSPAFILEYRAQYDIFVDFTAKVS